MAFIDELNDFIENKISEDKLRTTLASSKSYIARVGLIEEEINLCVKVFLESEHLDEDTRSELLQCFVPRVKISADTLNALLVWYFSNYASSTNNAQSFLSWLSVMLSNHLIDSKPVEKLFNQFLMCFFYTELVPSVCNVLKHVVSPSTVTPRSVFIAKYFYDIPVKYSEKAKIGCLLRLFHDSAPYLLPNPPLGNGILADPQDEFHYSVARLSFQQGFRDNLPFERKEPPASRLTTSQRKLRTNGFAVPKAWENLKNFPGAKGMKFLGWMIRNKTIPRSNSVASLIGSKAGQIYVCWQHIVEKNLPFEDKFTVLPILKHFMEICQRTRSGLPAIPTILSSYFVSWDGVEDQDIVYNILSWIHFETFEELYANVLCHILNLFFTGLLKDKICILDFLIDLIANKVTQVPRETTIKLICFVCRLIKVALADDGLRSQILLLSAVKFYRCVSCLEERYCLGSWTIPTPHVVFGAFLSGNHVLISEICELIVRHNDVMYPLYISLGLISNFSGEEEIIKTYLRDLYLFLWKGQASNTELVMSEEETVLAYFPKDFDTLLTVRNHYGIEPLILFVKNALKIGSSKLIKDKSLLKLLDSHAPGLSAVKKVYEG